MKKFIKQIIKEALDEALRDELPDYMINVVKKNNPDVANKFLDMDVPKHTELIPNVKVEIVEPSIKNKFIKEIQEYFTESILEQFYKTAVFKTFNDLNYAKIIAKSLNTTPKMVLGLSSTKITYFKFLKTLYSKNFTLLQGKDNNINNPIFSNNKSNLFTFVKSFNKAFPELAVDFNSFLNDRVFQGLREPIFNFEQNVMDLGKSKLYLYITDKPADVLRMSVSDFYSSCQNMYTGARNTQLLSNIFDKNSKIAYLIFDSPYVDNQGNGHPFTPIARTIIRVGENNRIMFDVTYPNRMEDDFYQIIERYAKIKNQGKEDDIYPYEYKVGLPKPYMDKYQMYSDGGDLQDKINVLARELDVDYNEIDIISDNRFNWKNQVYDIYDKEDANEYARDYFENNWLEELMKIGDDVTFYDIVVDYKIFDLKTVYNLLEIDDSIEDINQIGLAKSFKNYLENNNITTLKDFDKILEEKMKNITRNHLSWYRENLKNLNNVFMYFGGIENCRKIALAKYDNKEIYRRGYYIYLVNNNYEY
jgi:hypothetical protein